MTELDGSIPVELSKNGSVNLASYDVVRSSKSARSAWFQTFLMYWRTRALILQVPTIVIYPGSDLDCVGGQDRTIRYYEQEWQLLDIDLHGPSAGPKAACGTAGYFAHQRNRRGRQLGRVWVTWYDLGIIPMHIFDSHLVKNAQNW